MAHFLKPHSVNDITPNGRTVYSRPAKRVNLGYRRRMRVSITRIFKAGIIFVSSWFLIMGSVAAPTTTTLAANAPSSSEREQLEAQLKDLEAQIDQYENQIVSYQKQGSSLKNEVSRLNSQISKLNLQIKAINLTLSELDNKITDTQAKIVNTEASIESKKQVLAGLLQNMNETEQTSVMEIFLKNPKLSDFFADMNNISLLQNNVRLTIRQISDLRDELSDQKEQFSLARADAETVRTYQLTQKTQADQVKAQKNNLIAVTKGQETKYQQLLTETKKTAAEIRSRIFQLLGGGQLTFEQAYTFASMAGEGTGVRPALILAVLDRESALGQNVGRCKYDQINSTTGLPTMHPTRDLPYFLQLTSALNIDPSSVNVSCAIPRDGAYGGAMGPAQFIPSTWKLYADRIAKVTGRSPANPWNNADAFVGTALYLKDVGAAGGTLSDERKAAAKYYAGGNWSRFLWTYGEAVVSRANRFEEDIRAITS